MSAAERPPSRLEALQKRCEVATEGPWYPIDSSNGRPDEHVIQDGEGDCFGKFWHEDAIPNAVMCAAARTDLPDLARDFRTVAECLLDLAEGAHAVNLPDAVAICRAWLGVPE